jgi:hypothetical protein
MEDGSMGHLAADFHWRDRRNMDAFHSYHSKLHSELPHPIHEGEEYEERSPPKNYSPSFNDHDFHLEA